MNRRGFLRGVGALFVTAPAIVRASSLMAVKPWQSPTYEEEVSEFSINTELAAITRAAFVPRVLVQIYFANPTLSNLMTA